MFTICTNQFLFQKDVRESLKLVSKMVFSDVPYLQEIFLWNDTKSIINLLFNWNFQKLFVYGKTNKLSRPSENKNRNYPVYENVVWKR